MSATKAPKKVAWMPKSTVLEKAHALHILGDAIALRLHDYERDPASGAGNCWCGWCFHSIVHPHPFVPALKNPLRCVCNKAPNHAVHTLWVGSTEGDEP